MSSEKLGGPSKIEEKNINLQSDQSTTNLIKNSNQNNQIQISDVELKKAITFLLSKEMQDYSLEKKKEFLMSKLPTETVNKALDLYPLIESNISLKIKEYKDKVNNEGFSILPNLGIISSVVLASLGINYLLDLNRNKKNDLFFKECERKINEELQKLSKDLKTEINNELNEYVSKDSLKDKVNSHIIEYTHQKGLNLNLSTKTVKEDIVKIKEELSNKDKILKDLEVKIENNKVLLKSEILKETGNILEDNNNKLLMKIIDNQDKLLSMVMNAIKNSSIESSKEGKKNINTENIDLNLKLAVNDPFNDQNSQSNKNKFTEQITEIQNPNNNETSNFNKEEDSNFIQILEECINSIKEERDKIPFIKQLKNQFSSIFETMKKDENKSNLPFVNITNRVYKTVDINSLTKLLRKSNFNNENSSSIFKFQGDMQELKTNLDTFDRFDE